MRDFSSDLTIVVTGTGKTSMSNLRKNLEDWIFGDGDGREVHVIFALPAEPNEHTKTFAVWVKNVGAEVTVVKADDQPMSKEISALEANFLSYPADGVQEAALALLEDRRIAGDETAFVMLYDPANPQDVHDLAAVKELTSFSTLNLSEGMGDAFENYESPEDLAKRLRLEEEFKEKQLAAEPEKPAAKKAIQPRKRVAKKAVASKPVPSVEAAETPLQEPSRPLPERTHKDYCGMPVTHTGDCRMDVSITAADKQKAGLDKLIEKRVALENEKRRERLEATVQDRAHVGKEAVEIPQLAENFLPKKRREGEPALTDSHSWDLWDGGMGWTCGKCRRCGISYPSSGEWVDRCGAGTFTGETPDTGPTLSATASIGPKIVYEIVGAVPSVDSLLGSNVVSGIEKDVADHHFSMNVVQNRNPWDSSDTLLLELAENVAAMGQAFTDTISTLTKMIKERNV